MTPSPRCHSARDRNGCVKWMCYPAQNSLSFSAEASWARRVGGFSKKALVLEAPDPCSYLFTHSHQGHIHTWSLIIISRPACFSTQHPLLSHPRTADRHRAAIGHRDSTVHSLGTLDAPLPRVLARQGTALPGSGEPS